ncbi:hypothetical protein MBH78_17705 [Oceanimonas sp. NS1]|nr:hypothetical protein [Oceanimonas sp. NS1]
MFPSPLTFFEEVHHVQNSYPYPECPAAECLCRPEPVQRPESELEKALYTQLEEQAPRFTQGLVEPASTTSISPSAPTTAR